MNRKLAILTAALFTVVSSAFAQNSPSPEDRFNVWLPLQLIPNMTLYSSPTQSNFGFEWEVTPLLYSLGMNSQVSPWYSLIVEPTARFVGSVEITIAGQVFTTKLGSSYFSSSARITGFIPLAERGEHLTLNLGFAAYRVAQETRIFKVVGISTLFGIVHLNLKHADRPATWIGSFEFRIF